MHAKRYYRLLILNISICVKLVFVICTYYTSFFSFYSEHFKPLGVLAGEQIIKLGRHKPDKKFFCDVIEESERVFCEFCKVRFILLKRVLLTDIKEVVPQLISKLYLYDLYADLRCTMMIKT